MDASRSYNITKLLEIVENYFSDNKNVSERAEMNLLDRNISGEELIDILNGSLNELEKKNKNELQDKIYRIEELEKDYGKLKVDYDKLTYDHEQLEQYLEKYKPLIECVVSILEKTAKEEVKRLMKK